MAKEKAVVCTAKYIGKNDEVITTITTARDKDENVFVVYKTQELENKIIGKQEFLDNYEITVDGTRIEVPKQEKADEDIMKDFQLQNGIM